MAEEVKISDLVIEGEKGTFFTPSVNFNYETGKCVLEGESYLEDTWTFYDQLLSWLKGFAAEQRAIDFELRLTYFNTSSSKGILDLLKFLKTYQEEGGEVSVKWFYHEDDDDNYEEAEDFKEDTGLDIEIISFS